MNDILDKVELPAGYCIREALDVDVPAVMLLLSPFVERRQIMRRTEAETAALIPTGYSILFQEKLVGFAAVECHHDGGLRKIQEHVRVGFIELGQLSHAGRALRNAWRALTQQAVRTYSPNPTSTPLWSFAIYPAM